jgi:hypothetical protein
LSLVAAAGADSPDARWVVVAGLLREHGDAGVTCIVDRSDQSATLLDGAARQLSFSSDGTRALADGREIELAEKLDVEPTSSASPGGSQTANRGVTPDGRYVLHEGTCVVTPLESGSTGSGYASRNGLALLERETGRVVWEAPERCTRWRFSPGGRFVEKGRGTYGTHAYRVGLPSRAPVVGQLGLAHW